jgi:CRISPR-associated endoribonuclease Cas6
MRIKIIFTSSTQKVLINNQHLVNGYIHRLLGENNEYHDSKSNYCISQLCGGKLNDDKETLSFIKPYIIVTSNDEKLISRISDELFENPIFTHGMSFNDIQYIEETFINGWNHFFTLSPILLVEQEYGQLKRFITVNDPLFESKLLERTKSKINKIDPKINLDDFELKINGAKKQKKIMVKNVMNLASVTKISIKSSKKVAELLYNYGIGQSTGSGFGSIYKTENVNTYKF